MYKAKINIGGYKVGEEVPAEQAVVWESMYKESPVEKIEKTEAKTKDQPEIDKGNILNDYLARNKAVLKKNILEDTFTKDQLKELLSIEESDKKRKAVIYAIKERLSSFN